MTKLHSWINTFLVFVVAVGLLVLIGGQQSAQPVVTSTDSPVVGSIAGTRFPSGITTGGDSCTLTDANGGTYTLTEQELAKCSYLTFAAGGAGQAVIALQLPATSTLTSILPKAGDCRSLIYSAQNLAAATTTTVTAGTGMNVLAYTANDDVIDGLERAQLTFCRLSTRDVDVFTTEILNAD